MKLYGGGKIFIGLIIFVAFAGLPFFYHAVAGTEVRKPEPKTDTPAIQEWVAKNGKKQCVESKEFMRTEHMQLLNNWRDSVVRDGNRGYMGDDGTVRFNMSLQNSCMKCHSNKKKFCDECHTYMAVKPYCWDCHVAPKEDQKS